MTTPVRQQTVSNKDQSGSVASLTLTAVDGTLGGATAGIVVDVAWAQTAAEDLSDVTFDGSSILANEIGSIINQSQRAQRSFYVVGSSLASANVVITPASAALTIQASARVYSNVNQASPIGDLDSSNSGGVDGTATATADLTLTANDVVVDHLVVRNSPTITVGADQSETSTQTTGSTISHRTSEQAHADGGAMSWSWDSAQRWSHKAYVIQGTAAAGSAVPVLRHLQTLQKR